MSHSFADVIAPENLLSAWQEFVRGKRSKGDVQQFALDLTDNILRLHHELANGTYRHSGYETFHISDPKPRRIDKASIRDRLLHHAIYRVLYPFFDRTFIADSFSCRDGKGTHRALERFRAMADQVSHNNTRTCWVLKCDIRKFFESIDHSILLQILSTYIPDRRLLQLLREVIESFAIDPGRGLPLGNLTSQLFVNIYMNEFDRYVKHRLKAEHYIRYADDFVLLSPNRDWLLAQVPPMQTFLQENLSLSLHPEKIYVQTLAGGVDFLGWIHFPHHKVLRTTTKRRMLRRLRECAQEDAVQSYLGLLSHGNTFRLRQEVVMTHGLWNDRRGFSSETIWGIISSLDER